MSNKTNILRLFRDGYGTEDIAVILELDVWDVRNVLRGAGYVVMCKSKAAPENSQRPP